MKTNSTVKLNISSHIGDLLFKENLNDKYNPHDMDGIVIAMENRKVATNPIIVLWENGYKNSYEKRNLVEV